MQQAQRVQAAHSRPWAAPCLAEGQGLLAEVLEAIQYQKHYQQTQCRGQGQEHPRARGATVPGPHSRQGPAAARSQGQSHRHRCHRWHYCHHHYCWHHRLVWGAGYLPQVPHLCLWIPCAGWQRGHHPVGPGWHGAGRVPGPETAAWLPWTWAATPPAAPAGASVPLRPQTQTPHHTPVVGWRQQGPQSLARGPLALGRRWARHRPPFRPPPTLLPAAATTLGAA